jgi:hypothetical protein
MPPSSLPRRCLEAFWGPIALVIIAIMALVILVEWLIRTLILNRRDRSATAA